MSSDSSDANAKRAEYDKLAKIIATNINAKCKGRKAPKGTIADICHVTNALVTKWTAKDSTTIPSVPALITIADYLNVDVQWLWEDHTTYEYKNHIRTYSDALEELMALYDSEIIVDVNAIVDPILKYLMGRVLSLRNSTLAAKEFGSWIERIKKEFDIPITDAHNETKYLDDILMNENGIAAVDEDMKYRNLAKALYDKDVMQRSKDRMSIFDNVEKNETSKENESE